MLPNQITRWMGGGHTEQYSPSEELQQSKQGFDKGAGMAQSAQEEIHKGAREKQQKLETKGAEAKDKSPKK